MLLVVLRVERRELVVVVVVVDMHEGISLIERSEASIIFIIDAVDTRALARDRLGRSMSSNSSHSQLSSPLPPHPIPRATSLTIHLDLTDCSKHP